MQRRSWLCQSTLGAAIPACSVTVYVSGSLVKATLYGDQAGSTQLGNPITGGSDGSYAYYAPDGRYTEVLTAPGFTFGAAQTQDFILHDPFAIPAVAPNVYATTTWLNATPVCTNIPAPTTGKTFCFDQTANLIKAWDGSVWSNVVLGGTGQNTSAWSGVPTINAGTWVQNNILTANQIPYAAAGNTLTSSSGFTFDGTTLTVLGTNGSSSAPGLLLLNNKLISWKDAANGFTNAAFLYVDTANALYLGTGNSFRTRIGQGGDTTIGGNEITATAGRVFYTQGGGLQLGAPSGGDKGSGSINASAYYVHGTAIASMPLTNASGTVTNAPHMVQDTVTLAGGTAGVALAGAAAFTNATSYTCVCDNDSAVLACRVVQNGGNGFTLTSGAGTDVVRFICVGN